jgi:hypothetical protein
VSLDGEKLNLSTGSDDWHTIVVSDLSMSGLRFTTNDPNDIEIGHRLHVKFTLDDHQASEIDKEVRVIAIKDDHYRCEFLNLAYQERELGAYLFPS